ncbi:mitochondrial ribosomal protein L37-domain-containing protein [Bisporella sp. PMI_857]|nr:mitochondrial ribosomal protein L37-domain-containing protein [Bisporella sp. PMI_857]
MICRTCLRARAALSHQSQYTRQFSTSLRQLTPANTPLSQTPSTISPAAQPSFGTPLPNLPNPAGVHAKLKSKSKTAVVELPQSIAPAGTALQGINYIKGIDDPIAKEEEAYPEWLWKVLETKAKEENTDFDGDEFSKSKKVRRAAAKRQRKLEARLAASGDIEALRPKIPITRQTIDLPGNEEGGLEGALEAEGKREELRAAMRRDRRKDIKGKNYLKSM